MDTHKINALLHASHVPHHYSARVGDRLAISLPRIPLTRYTEFLRLEPEKQGDLNCFAEEPAPDLGEGVLLPHYIVGKAIRPGKLHIVLHATDSLSGERLCGVEPLDIAIEIRKA